MNSSKSSWTVEPVLKFHGDRASSRSIREFSRLKFFIHLITCFSDFLSIEVDTDANMYATSMTQRNVLKATVPHRTVWLNPPVLSLLGAWARHLETRTQRSQAICTSVLSASKTLVNQKIYHLNQECSAKKEVWESRSHAFPPHCTIDWSQRRTLTLNIVQKPSHAKRSFGSRSPLRETGLPVTYSATALKLQD